MSGHTLSQVISDAIADMEKHGFDSAGRLEYWQKQISLAAERESETELNNKKLGERLARIYDSQVVRGRILSGHKIQTWTLDKIKPKLRIELDRRMMASAQLIKLNRDEMILRTMRRFSGWAMSLPVGGTEALDKRYEAGEIKKGIKQLPYTERRVMIDQGHKFKASLDAIVARDAGAIAAEWTVRKTPNYTNRKEHLARAGKIFLMRDSWALRDGYIKPNGHQFADEIDQPAEKIYCSCVWRYIYNLRDVPELLTRKGKQLRGEK